MPLTHFPQGIKPPTIFQMSHWHEQSLTSSIDSSWLAKFELRDQFSALLRLRDRVYRAFELDGALDAVSKRNPQLTEIHFHVPSVDSDEAGLLELLGEDIEDFFFGVPVVIETEYDGKRACIKKVKEEIEMDK